MERVPSLVYFDDGYNDNNNNDHYLNNNNNNFTNHNLAYHNNNNNSIHNHNLHRLTNNNNNSNNSWLLAAPGLRNENGVVSERRTTLRDAAAPPNRRQFDANHAIGYGSHATSSASPSPTTTTTSTTTTTTTVGAIAEIGAARFLSRKRKSAVSPQAPRKISPRLSWFNVF